MLLLLEKKEQKDVPFTTNIHDQIQNLPENILSRLMKNPADIINSEKKVWAKKQDSWKLGSIADDNMASDRLQ